MFPTPVHEDCDGRGRVDDTDCDGRGECQPYTVDHAYDLRIFHVPGCDGGPDCSASARLLYAAELRLRDARRARTGFIAASHYAESVRAKLGLPTHTR